MPYIILPRFVSSGSAAATSASSAGYSASSVECPTCPRTLSTVQKCPLCHPKDILHKTHASRPLGGETIGNACSRHVNYLTTPRKNIMSVVHLSLMSLQNLLVGWSGQ